MTQALKGGAEMAWQKIGCVHVRELSGGGTAIVEPDDGGSFTMRMIRDGNARWTQYDFETAEAAMLRVDSVDIPSPTQPARTSS